MRLSILSIVLLLWSCMGAYAQLALSDPSPVSSMAACEASTFSVIATKTSGVYGPTDSVVLLVNHPANMAHGTVSASPGVSVLSTSPSPTQLRIRLMGMTGTTVQAWYDLTPECPYFQGTTTTGLQNTVSSSLNGVAGGNLTTLGYNVYSAWLVYNAGQSLRVNYSLAAFNVPYTRRLVYINTSNTAFTGDFTFRDTSEFNAGVAVQQFQGISVAHPSGASYTQYSQVVNDTTLEVKGFVNGLASGDSIVVVETLVVTDCPTTTNTSITHFNLWYGCAAPECRSVGFGQTSAALDPNNKPVLKIRDLNITNLCPADPDTHLLAYINTGTGLADTMFVTMIKELGNNLSYFDTATVELFTRTGMIETPVPFFVLDYLTHTNSLTPTECYQYHIGTLFPPAPGDTVFLRYREEKICLDENADFDTRYIMNAIMERCSLGHPCFPTPNHYYDTDRTAWGDPSQAFEMQQMFENYTGAMNGGDEAWFNVSNQTPLEMNMNHVYFPDEVFLDSGKVEFQVELILEEGLGLVLDSFYLNSFQFGVDSLWWPTTFAYAMGDGVNRGTGDTVTASFKVPNYFFEANTPGVYKFYGAEIRKSASYLAFFNRFEVRFKLRAYCPYMPDDSKSTIQESSYLVYDNTCNPHCRIPLSRVEDEVNLLCPGCILPGWNLTRFDVERLNFGWEDADNNNYPDAYPLTEANSPNLKRKRVCIGDTLLMVLEGHTSDGEDLLFNNIGFEFDYAQLRLYGAVFENFEFLGATGYYTKLGIDYPFTVPVGGGVFSPGRFEINLDVSTLIAYGVPSGVIDSIAMWDELHIEPRFRVAENLDSGSGGDPNFSVESLDAMMFMSGVPITNSLVDANLDVPTLITQTPVQRAGYLYWCTGFTGRFTGIGVHFQNAVGVENYAGIWGVTGTDFCWKKLKMTAYSDLGETHSGDVWHHDASNQTALNAFSFEVRDFFKLDSISFTIPQDYLLDRIQFRISSLWLDTLSNQTAYACAPDWYAPYLYPLGGTSSLDSTVTIYPVHYYEQLTEGSSNPLCGSVDLWQGDETKRVSVELLLKLADCDSTRDSINLSGAYPVKAYWSNYPGVGDTVIVKNMPNNTWLDKPSATLATQVIPSILSTSSNTLSWDLNLSTVAPSSSWYDQVYNGTSYNNFVTFVSPNNTIQVTGVVHTNGSPQPVVIPDIDGHDAWGIDALGYGTLYAMEISATYNCASNFGLDSLYMITGWNCYNYPTTLDEACYVDTVVVYVQPEVAGMQASLSVDSAVNVCDTAHFVLELKATGNGDVNDVQAAWTLPAGLNYVAGSGMLTYESNSGPVDPVGGVWYLDSVPFFVGNFDGSQGEAYLEWDMVVGCDYTGLDLLLSVTADNYCGQLIGPIALQDGPEAVMGTASNDTMAVAGGTVNANACLDTTTFTLGVANLGVLLSGSGNILTVTLPSGTTWTGGTPYTSVSGQVLTFDLPSGMSSGSPLAFTVSISGISSLPGPSVTVPLSVITAGGVSCDTNVCAQGGDTVNGTATIHLLRPNISLSSINLTRYCKDAALRVQLTNLGPVVATGIPIRVYCMDGVNDSCLIASTTVPMLGVGGSTAPVMSVVNYCSGCEILVAVAGEGACVQSIAISRDSIDCPDSCKIICPDDIYVRVDCDEKGCHLNCKHKGGFSSSGRPIPMWNPMSVSPYSQDDKDCPKCWHMGCDDDGQGGHSHHQHVSIDDCKPKCDVKPWGTGGGAGTKGDEGHGNRDEKCDDCCHATLHDIGCPTLEGDCRIQQIYNDAPAGNVFPLGTTIVTWTILDGNGEYHTCEQSVTVTNGYEAVMTSVTSVEKDSCTDVKLELYCNDATCELKQFSVEVPCGKLDPRYFWNSEGLPMTEVWPDPATGWYGFTMGGIANFCKSRPTGSITIQYRVCGDKFCEGDVAFVVGDCIEYADLPVPVKDVKKAEGDGRKPVSELEVFPSPFDAATQVRFRLEAEDVISLKVHNGQGQVVAVLAEQKLEAGIHQYSWVPDTQLANGVYTVTLRGLGWQGARRVVLMR